MELLNRINVSKDVQLRALGSVILLVPLKVHKIDQKVS